MSRSGKRRIVAQTADGLFRPWPTKLSNYSWSGYWYQESLGGCSVEAVHRVPLQVKVQHIRNSAILNEVEYVSIPCTEF